MRGLELAVLKSVLKSWGVPLGKGHPFIHAARANHIAAPGCGTTVKG
jgi:hypothetical protein